MSDEVLTVVSKRYFTLSFKALAFESTICHVVWEAFCAVKIVSYCPVEAFFRSRTLSTETICCGLLYAQPTPTLPYISTAVSVNLTHCCCAEQKPKQLSKIPIYMTIFRIIPIYNVLHRVLVCFWLAASQKSFLKSWQ